MHRFLTGALEDVSKASGLNQRFLGLIVLPIAGNACEHITACFVAMKNKMDLSIGVALGSSIQASSSASTLAVWARIQLLEAHSLSPLPTCISVISPCGAVADNADEH